MWPPVRIVFDVLDCALKRLTEEKRAAYFGLLADQRKHHEEHTIALFSAIEERHELKDGYEFRLAASVTAAVMLSPVSVASSWTSRCVSSFLILSPISWTFLPAVWYHSTI